MIITALGNPELNTLIKNKNKDIYEKDIQYKEGIIEILEKKSNIEFIIINESIPGKISLIELIDKIIIINKKIKIIIILEKKDKKKEKSLKDRKVYKIYYNNLLEKDNLIYSFKEEEEFYSKEILEKEQLNNKRVTKNNKIKKYIKNRSKTIKKKQKKIITVMGYSGVGKTTFIINLIKYLQFNNILIIDCDFKFNCIHTYFNLKKPQKKIIDKRIEKENFIIKINNKVNLISSIYIENFLNDFNKLTEKYDLIIIENTLENKNIKDFLKISNTNILLVEPNLIGIKKAKKIIDENICYEYLNKTKIIFNKSTIYSIDYHILKIIFDNVIGKIKLRMEYDLNINIKNNSLKKDFFKIINNIMEE